MHGVGICSLLVVAGAAFAVVCGACKLLCVGQVSNNATMVNRAPAIDLGQSCFRSLLQAQRYQWDSTQLRGNPVEHLFADRLPRVKYMYRNHWQQFPEDFLDVDMGITLTSEHAPAAQRVYLEAAPARLLASRVAGTLQIYSPYATSTVMRSAAHEFINVQAVAPVAGPEYMQFFSDVSLQAAGYLLYNINIT